MYFYIQAEVNDIEETRNMGKAAVNQKFDIL